MGRRGLLALSEGRRRVAVFRNVTSAGWVLRSKAEFGLGPPLVPEAKGVKNRVHLDLLVGREACDGEVERLEGLGATKRGVHDDESGRWVLMADPEGNEFDVA